MLRVCLAASELTPLAKTGGLADVVAALADHLSGVGCEVLLLVPLYGRIDRSGLRLETVERAASVPLAMGGRQLSFRLLSAPLPGASRSAVRVHLVDCPELFGGDELYTGDVSDAYRFGFFSRAVLESCQRLQFSPDVLHCHDWHTALIPLLLTGPYAWDRDLFGGTRTLLTLHNVAFQGVFGRDVLPGLGLEEEAGRLHLEHLAAGRVNFLETGVLHADLLSTVSPTHAREIQTSEQGWGLDGLLRERGDRVVGILNGIDASLWDPANDPHLPHHYSRDDLSGKRAVKRHVSERLGFGWEAAWDEGGGAAGEPPLFGIVSRLTYQKGLDLCFEALPPFLAESGARLLVVGSGEARYTGFFRALEERFGSQVRFHEGFSEELAHQTEAASDFFLMPSRYEPCGLNQMYSLRYGTVPIVRATGGLADSVRPFDPETGEGTGVVFEDFDAPALAWALDRALELWRRPEAMAKLRAEGMAEDFSWERQVEEYLSLYAWLVREGGP